MAGPYTQDTRAGKLTTPLGDDVLLLSRFWAEEELSQVHPYHIEALSADGDLDFDQALGRNCTLKLIAPDGLERCFCGVLVEAELKGVRDDLHVYQRPWLWLLNTRRRPGSSRTWRRPTSSRKCSAVVDFSTSATR